MALVQSFGASQAPPGHEYPPVDQPRTSATSRNKPQQAAPVRQTRPEERSEGAGRPVGPADERFAEGDRPPAATGPHRDRNGDATTLKGQQEGGLKDEDSARASAEPEPAGKGG